MPSSLVAKTVHAVSWSLVESASVQFVRFAVGIVLARLLLPAEFGLIGMLMVFIAVAQSLLDGGFGVALTQKREASQIDYCSTFYLNILVGMAAAALLCLAAPWVAAFYRQPVLTPLLRTLSLTLLIDSFSLIHNTILIRRLDFKTLTKVSLTAAVPSGLGGIALAITGFGVWSLAFVQVSGAVVRGLCLWSYTGWRPTLLFSVGALRALFGFGSRMLVSNVMNQLFENIYVVVIGKLFSPADLGFFTRAKTLQEFPSNTLSAVVGRVTFPVFARLQDDPVRLKRGMKRAMATLVFVNSPVMVGLAIVAHPLILVILTEKWTPAVPYLQLLCVAGLLYPMHVMNLNVLTALGRPDLFLRLEIIKKLLVVLSIAVTWRWGISAMIWGMTLTSIVAYYANSYYTARFIAYPPFEQLRDSVPYLVTALAMAVVTNGAGLLLSSPLATLLLQVLVGAATYVFLCMLFRLPAFSELWQHIRGQVGIVSGAAEH